MKTRWKVPLLVGSTMILGMFVLGLIPTEVPSGPLQESKIGYRSLVCVYKNGKEIQCSENTLMNLGKNHTTSQLTSKPSAASATDIIDKIMLGNTSDPVNTDIAHAGNITECGLSQSTARTWRFVSDTGTEQGNVTTDNQWTMTGCGNEYINVNTTGLETNGLTYFAGDNFADVNLTDSDTLNVTWYIWIT